MTNGVVLSLALADRHVSRRRRRAAERARRVEYNLRAHEDSEKQMKRFLETPLGP